MSLPELNNNNASGIQWNWPSVIPDGRKFVLIAGVLAFLFTFFIWDELGFALIGLTIWVAAFFRDPVRVTPQDRNMIVAPADGLVTFVGKVPPPRELLGADGLGDQPMTRVSIFMSVFDVHINRSPIAGTIKQVIYISGKFLNADLDKASEDNERQHIVVERDDGLRIGFTQIAGLVARRIVPFVKPGDIVAAGQRVGLIRFGSRVDVFFPEGTAPRVVAGQRSVAGETVLGVIGEMPVLRGVAQ